MVLNIFNRMYIYVMYMYEIKVTTSYKLIVYFLYIINILLLCKKYIKKKNNHQPPTTNDQSMASSYR